MANYRSILLVLAVAHSGAALAAETGSSARAIVEKMFELGSKNSPTVTAELLAMYNKLTVAAPRDRRNVLAYATVLLAQRRYRDARTLLDAVLKAKPADEELRMLKVRAMLGEHRLVELMAEVDLLGRSFARPVDEAAEQTRLDLAEFLGTVFGYVELARPDSGDLAERNATKVKLLSRLGHAELAAFDKSRNDTARLIGALNAQLDMEQKRIDRINKLNVDAAHSSLDDAKERLNDQDSTAQSSKETAFEAAREASVIALQLDSLRQDRLRVGARYAALQAQLQMIIAPTTSSNNVDLTRPGDPRPIITTTATTTSVPIDRLAQASAVSFQLAAVNKQALDMDRKIVTLQSRLAEISGEFDRSAGALEDTEAASRDIEREAKMAEKLVKRPPKVSKARLTALKAQRINFATYAPFDYDAEKARVLSLFDN